jgi:hypothetical protein
VVSVNSDDGPGQNNKHAIYRKKIGRLMKLNCRRHERRRSRGIFLGYHSHISMERMSKPIKIPLSGHSISESSLKHGISRIASTSASHIITTLMSACWYTEGAIFSFKHCVYLKTDHPVVVEAVLCLSILLVYKILCFRIPDSRSHDRCSFRSFYMLFSLVDCQFSSKSLP